MSLYNYGKIFVATAYKASRRWRVRLLYFCAGRAASFEGLNQRGAFSRQHCLICAGCAWICKYVCTSQRGVCIVEYVCARAGHVYSSGQMR